MTTTSVTWIQSKSFMGIDSTQHSVVLSSPSDGIGMKPSDLLLVSLGGCTAVDVVGILTKKHLALANVTVTVSGEQNADPPWAFEHIHIHYAVTGQDIKREDVEKAIRLSKEKYCSVSATLSVSVDITYDFEVNESYEPEPA